MPEREWDRGTAHHCHETRDHPSSPLVPGKRTLVESVTAPASAAPPRAALQAKTEPAAPLLDGGGSVKVATPAARNPFAVPAGGGARLPAQVQAKMEGSFGADFGDVRVHEGSSQAAAIGAEAFTYGNDIHFAPGSYAPGSPQGQQLIGHELTHVVQQRAGRVAPTAQAYGVSLNQDASLEREADEHGSRAAQGQPVSGTGGGRGAVGAPVIQGVFIGVPQAQGAQQPGFIALPGVIPPPWLGASFYFLGNVYYPAHQFP